MQLRVEVLAEVSLILEGAVAIGAVGVYVAIMRLEFRVVVK
jgi:hypothetical protein